MQFGLCGASATFQRFTDEVTRNLEGVYAFVDNILITSRDPEEHHKHLKALFSRLHEYGLSINVSKCVFGVSKIDFLGFHLSEEGIQPLPTKSNALQSFPNHQL
ncbi:transposon Ty3-I Gag-Pol polyprotein [Trichonephila clavipes]|nr:transposon Ty3-I Gag-Pol polyprotein [Trichonephila clavipes]